jgi:hypothetical protein
MDLLEKFAQKKKNPGINQCGEKGGGYYIPAGSIDFRNINSMYN